MKYLMKTKMVAAAGALALAAFLTAPANAAIVLGGDNGWEVSYGGFINLFYTQSDFDFAGGGTEDSAHLNEGLLPAFHTLTAKSPEINGLKGTAQITFAVDSSGNKNGRLQKETEIFGSNSRIDMREVFFNVEGDFGTISAGNTLSLFMRQSILKDYTLFGVGGLAGPDGSGTALGRIGWGYVYPDFRTRFTYKTPDINGFVLEVGIFDPQEPLGANVSETDTPQFQAEATYNTTFEGGTFNFWAGMLWQEQTLFLAGGSDDVTSFGFNIGADVTFGAFNVMGTWYTGEALGTTIFNLSGTGDQLACSATACDEQDNDGFIVQGSYTFNGKTKVGVSYGESNEDGNVTFGTTDFQNDMWTVGVYHDVNSWLKVVAEYSNYESSLLGITDADTFSIGGFILW